MSRAWRPDKANSSKKRTLEERTGEAPRETREEPPPRPANSPSEREKQTAPTETPDTPETEVPGEGTSKSAEQRWTPGQKKEGSGNTNSASQNPGDFAPGGSAPGDSAPDGPISEQPGRHSASSHTGGAEEETGKIPVARRTGSESTEPAGKKAEIADEPTSSFGTTMIKKVLRRQKSPEDNRTSPESPDTSYSGGDKESGDSTGTDSSETTSGGGFLSSISSRLRRQGPLSPEREAQDREEQDNRSRKPDVEPGGSMDPNERVKRIRHDIQSGDHEPGTASEEEEEDREGLVEKGPFLWILNHYILIAVPLILLCIGTFVFATLYTQDSSEDEMASGEGGSAQQDRGAGGEPTTVQGNSQTVPLYDSGLAFEYSETDGGTVELTAGDISWTGEVTTSEGEGPGETVALSGPTAAKIIRGYQMGDGSGETEEVATMTYAVEVEGAPDFYATSQQFSGADAGEQTPGANGSYTVTEDSGALIAEGNYSDKRTGDGDEVIRTYTETVPGQEESEEFQVRYEAPEDAPIPALVGWQEPADRQAAAEEERG